MDLKTLNETIPNGGAVYKKLKSYPDGTKIEVTGAYIASGNFGEQAYFIDAEGANITLPTRYVPFIESLINDEEAYKEVQKHAFIKKGSRSTPRGETATFEFC